MSNPPTPPRKFRELDESEKRSLAFHMRSRTRKYTLDGGIAVAVQRYNVDPGDAELRAYAERCIAERDAAMTASPAPTAQVPAPAPETPSAPPSAPIVPPDAPAKPVQQFPSAPPPKGKILKLSEDHFRRLGEHNSKRPLYAVLNHWNKRLSPAELAALVAGEINQKGLYTRSGVLIREGWIQDAEVLGLLQLLQYPGAGESAQTAPNKAEAREIPYLPKEVIDRLAATYFRSWGGENGRRALNQMLSLASRKVPRLEALGKFTSWAVSELQRTHLPPTERLAELYNDLAARASRK